MSYTLTELLALCGKSNSPRSVEAATIGLVLSALAEGPALRPQSLSWHMGRLAAALDSRQVGVLFDRFGQLCGLALWASVAPEVSSRLLRDGPESLLPSEIQSGDETWIFELVSRYGELPLVLETLRDDWLRSAPRVTYFRNKRGRRIAKRVSRTDPLSFFRRPAKPPSQAVRFLQTKEAEGFRHAAAQALDAALELGEVAQVARLVPNLAGMPLPLALARLCVPIKNLQRRLYRQRDDTLCGFLSWAWVDDTLISTGAPAPHQMAPFQWSEGRNLMVCDAIARPTGIEPIVDDLVRGIVPDEPTWLRTAHDSTAPSQVLRLSDQDLIWVRRSSLGSEPATDLLQHLGAIRGARRC
jgi:hemolysin-activating ACP:hemolysin acyltransferase